MTRPVCGTLRKVCTRRDRFCRIAIGKYILRFAIPKFWCFDIRKLEYKAFKQKRFVCCGLETKHIFVFKGKRYTPIVFNEIHIKMFKSQIDTYNKKLKDGIRIYIYNGFWQNGMYYPIEYTILGEIVSKK